ncbi:hypothetical protein ILUMI_26163 [Ignelater luminosus]|uniref:Gustatory receptor n=1 Tax=Ignelater luminosus TaxID=2038154 RepID=A0A8K0FZ75_IGNLU|nr:hypothetical protein ILUMI_26163 [Ignelater luminosus]
MSKKEVAISSQIYESCKPVIFVCRVLGLFPVSICRKTNQLYLKWSRLYTIYSCTLGITITILAYYGLSRDILNGKTMAIKIRSQTHMYVIICDVSVLIAAVLCGIFSNIFNCCKDLKLINYFNKVDAIIPLTNTKRIRNTAIRMITIILTVTAFITIADLVMYYLISNNNISKILIWECYGAFYLTFYIALINEYKFCFLGYCILKRLEQLNKHLGVDNFKNENIEKILKSNINACLPQKACENNTEKAKSMNALALSKLNYIDTHTRMIRNRIYKLILAHDLLCDATKILNELYGLNNAVTIIGILWHLIETPYLLISELTGNRKDSIYLTVLFLWCLLHIGRLMLLAQPCHSCLNEAQKTSDLVCKLLFSLDSDREVKSKLRDFALILLHRKFEFTASGLIAVNRALVTTIVGAITTYLVILLQFARSEQ